MCVKLRAPFMNWLTYSQRLNLNIFLKIKFQHTFNVFICRWLNLSAQSTYCRIGKQQDCFKISWSISGRHLELANKYTVTSAEKLTSNKSKSHTIRLSDKQLTPKHLTHFDHIKNWHPSFIYGIHLCNYRSVFRLQYATLTLIRSIDIFVSWKDALMKLY